MEPGSKAGCPNAQACDQLSGDKGVGVWAVSTGSGIESIYLTLRVRGGPIQPILVVLNDFVLPYYPPSAPGPALPTYLSHNYPISF